MNYVQAVEGYHRRRLNRTRYPPDVFERHKVAVLQDVHGEPRQLAKSALRWANELSLERRILDVLDVLGEPGSRILNAGRRGVAPTQFAQRTAQIRNAFAHAFETPKPEQDELTSLTLQLKALVEALLLREVKFDATQISAMLEHGNRYRMIQGW